MTTNEMKNKLTSLEEQLRTKASIQANEEAVYTMFANVAGECTLQLQKMNQITDDTSAGEAILEEITDLLEQFVEMPYHLLISKKTYENFDEIMAELDDWVESINELIETHSEPFSYMEAWDLGVFFE